jgi:hypothetical protein
LHPNLSPGILKLSPTNLERPTDPPPVEEYTEAPIWLQRLFVATYVLFCMVLGIWLVALPWSGKWFDDGLVASWPALQNLLQLGFVKGAVTGLGLVDIWIGVLEAVNYHDRVPVQPSAVPGSTENSHDRHP